MNSQNKQWYYLDKKHETFGVLDVDELHDLHKRKVITDKSYIWREGFDDWKRFKDVQSDYLIEQYNIENSSVNTQAIHLQNTSNDSFVQSENIAPKINYKAPYKVVWVSEEHRNNVTHLTQKIKVTIAEQRKLESFRISPTKPDGLIIGTGEADFTKGNVPYEFTYKEKTFQLIDVPGIEGDEGKYEHLVKQAIEKAHLVIYVNGTNKKPEEITARKIKNYINQYATIYAICNVRGKADSYEFEEDQESLFKTHGDIDNVLNQTVTVLNQTVGHEFIEGSQCIQGLLAFSALAFDQGKGATTISLSRKDLIKSQKAYKYDFKSLEKMKNFSQVNMLEDKIISKFSTFELDIIESNKRKIVRKIEETTKIIQQQLNNHIQLQNKIKIELDAGRDSINRASSDFESMLTNKCGNAVGNAFSNMVEDGCTVIEKYFGDKDTISSSIQSIVKDESSILHKQLEKIKKDTNKAFLNNINETIRKLGKNIEQVQLNFDLEQEEEDLKINFDISGSSSTFEFNSMAKGLMDIGGAAALGASIGMVFPVVGNIAGALLGGVFEILRKLWNAIFSNKEKEIKKAQSNYRSNVNSSKQSFNYEVNRSLNEMLGSIRQDIDKTVISKMYDEYEKMRDVERILTSQIQKLLTLENKIKSKDYGTI